MPRVVLVDITTDCNHNCRGCLFGREGVFTDIKTSRQNLSKEVVFSLIDDMKKLGIPRIYFTGGGEPLVHPSKIEILSYARDKGIKYGITSNLDVVLDSQLINLLTKCSPYHIRVSMWASNRDNYLYWHGVDGFDRVVGNLKKLIEGGSKPQLAYVLWKDNIKDIRRTVKLSKELGCGSFWMIPAYSKKYEKALTVDEVERVKEELRLAKQETDLTIYSELGLHYKKMKVKNCNFPYFRVHIDALGYVYPCWIHKYTPSFAYGNIKEASFKNIMESPSRLEYLKNFICETHFCKFQRTRKGEFI